jgi:hypothetical protein
VLVSGRRKSYRRDFGPYSRWVGSCARRTASKPVARDLWHDVVSLTEQYLLTLLYTSNVSVQMYLWESSVGYESLFKSRLLKRLKNSWICAKRSCASAAVTKLLSNYIHTFIYANIHIYLCMFACVVTRFRTLMMEAEETSKPLVNFCETTQCNISYDSRLQL